MTKVQRSSGEMLISVIEIINGIYGAFLAGRVLILIKPIRSLELYQLSNAPFIGVTYLISSLLLIILGVLLLKGIKSIRKMHLFLSPLIAITLVNNLGPVMQSIYEFQIPFILNLNEFLTVMILILIITLLYVVYFTKLIWRHSS